MSIFGGDTASSSGGYGISNSLRFRASGNTYLTRTPASAGNRKTWTWSGWVKRGTLSGTLNILDAYLIDNNAETEFRFSGDVLQFYTYTNPSYSLSASTSAVFRDPFAWYHLVLFVDTTQATSSNGIKIWINGAQQVLTFSAYTRNASTYINDAVFHRIGRNATGAYPLDGYIAEVNFIDGQALDPSYFGEQDSDGVWVPKKYTGTYGTNGFYLDFKDGTSLTTLGYDAASSNDWTLTNHSLTAGANYDWMIDTPTNNYAVLNPIGAFKTTAFPATISEANTKLTGVSATNRWTTVSQHIESGKWYAEFILLSAPTVSGCAVQINTGATDSQWNFYNGQIYVNSSLIGTYSTCTTNDVVGVAIDRDSNTIAFYKNGVLVYTASSVNGGTMRLQYFTGSTDVAIVLTGKAPLHASATYDTASGGYFRYIPPTGFKALCTANLSAVSITKPSDHHTVKLDTGANIKSTCEATYASFLEWIKDRANANNHQLIDSVRGTSAVLQSNSTGAETTYTAPTGTSVGWVWKANGSGTTNNNGSITSTVSANTAAGFSIVTFTGTGANATVGHGLGVAPKMILVKPRNIANGWYCYHAILGATKYMALEGTSAATTLSTVWNNTEPTSSVFSIGPAVSTNTQVAYCFAEIPGYSKFDSYTGNGSTDGPFVYCGFRPKFLLIKKTSGTSNWSIIDTARDANNIGDNPLLPNSANAESTSTSTSGAYLDVTSNGFKLRGTSSDINDSAGTYIFAAFAEHPFGGSNVSPSPAR